MSYRDEPVTYMGHHWVQVQGDLVVIGLNEEALNEIETIDKINFPNESEEVTADEPCGEIETNDGHLNIYSPVDGTVNEINPELKDNSGLIFSDPYGEGWLMKVTPSDDTDMDSLMSDISED